ncbi:unnamed protein product [Effrenium voratum]|nr:unnamed protein product [Effrenium voratum]
MCQPLALGPRFVCGASWLHPQSLVFGARAEPGVLPFFDQFERRLRFWSPSNDAVVYADWNSEVWVQPFPRSMVDSRSPHPLQSLGGGDRILVAPQPFRIAQRASYACWSPL